MKTRKIHTCKLFNSVSNKFYVGSTCNAIRKRVNDHKNGFKTWIKNNKTVAEEFAENRYIDRAIEYLLEVGHYDEDALEQAFKSASEKLKEKMLTTRQRIENRGLRRGMQNKALDIARYMLHALHLGVDKVQEATGLSRQLVHQIAQEEA